MRIALVVSGGVDQSGRERIIPALVWLVERIARRHELHVYVLRYLASPTCYRFCGATVHDLGRPSGILAQRHELVTALRRDGPFDVIHAYWALPGGLAGALAARHLGVPAIVTMDSGEFVAIPDIDYGLQLRWRQRLGVSITRRLAARVTVCSRYQEQLARLHGVTPVVIPLGIDTAIFVPAARPEGPPWRLLHVANLNRVKDQGLLLDGFAQLLKRMPDVHLDIIGADTLNGRIQKMAAACGVARHVTFHGFLPTDELVPFYQRSHVAIVTSRHEAAGVVSLEAAACGVPTVGTPVGYVADWTPEAAAAVEAGTGAALSDELAELLPDRARRARIAAAARGWALTHDADWTAREFERLYSTVAALDRGAARDHHGAVVSP